MADSLIQSLPDRAIVLHCQPYRETSLFIDVLTERHGRLRLLGRGARRGRQPLARILRPFHCVFLSWVGRGELPVLTAAEEGEGGAALTGTALYCAFYLAELLMRLLPAHDPHPDVFALSLATLRRLECGTLLQGTLRSFEVDLLEAIGYGMRLDEDAGGRPIEPGRPYLYHPEQGAVPTNPETAGAIQGASLLALGRRQGMDASQLRDAKRLMRGILQHHLNGRPLRSRELFTSRPPPADHAS